MAKLSIKPGSIDVTVYVLIQDTTSTTGAGKTGLVYWSTGMSCYYVRTRSAATAIGLTDISVTSSHVDGGFVEVSSANMPGVYRLDLPDAVCAAGARSAVVMLKGVTGMAPVTLEIDLSNDANLEYWKGAAAQAMTGDAYATAILVKAKTDTLPASPAAVGSAMTLTEPYDAAKTAATQASVDDLAADVADGLDELEAALLGGLSGATVTVVSSVDGGTVTVYVADTWRFTVASDQLDLAGYETLGLVVKRNVRQADSQALLYLRSDTGLARIGGAAPASAGNGTLTAGASSFTAVVHVAETLVLTPGGYTWWLKGLDTSATPDEAVTLATGEFVVLAAGLQAVA